MKREITSPENATVAFRLDKDSRQSLEERAARLGVSAHLLAKHYVELALAWPQERSQWHEAVVSFNDCVVALREDFATVTKALLVNAGKVEAEEAERWVVKTFK